MPITSFTIDGVEVNCLFDSFNIRETVGDVSTLSCDVISLGSPVTRFTVFSPVVVEEDSVKIFSGTVKQVLERGFGGHPNLYDSVTGAEQIVTRITAEDHFDIGERKTVTLEVADGTTLKDALIDLVAQLSSLGITLHPSQATGPTLPAMSFTLVRASEVIRAFSDATGWLSIIDYDKQLRMFAQGDLPAPFDIDEFDDPPSWTGDVEVENILGDDYANRVIVIVDLPSEEAHVETFAGDGVTDTFTLSWTLEKAYGIIHIYELDGITPAGGETFAIVGTDTFTQWEYYPLTNTITRIIGPTDATKIYKLTFKGFFHAEAIAEDAAAIAANGLYEIVITNPPGVESQEAAQELADAVLAASLLAAEQKTNYVTRFTAPNLRAGQLQEIVATARGLSGDYIVTNISVTAETPATATYAAAGLGLIRSISAKKNNPMGGRYQDTYRDWLERGGSGAVSVGDAGPISSGPAPPVTSNQFNDGGVFGGNANWTFDKNTSTVMIGSEHTPGGSKNLLNGIGHTIL